jgi:hypothetical protein
VRETPAAMKKRRLSDDAVRRIDRVWESVKTHALFNNFEITGKP